MPKQGPLFFASSDVFSLSLFLFFSLPVCPAMGNQGRRPTPAAVGRQLGAAICVDVRSRETVGEAPGAPLEHRRGTCSVRVNKKIN